jgi:geranylgeranyl reductase family protein
VQQQPEWDVAVVGGGPAGLAAAHAAAMAGASTVILERAEHPRYKTCGGGLIGASLNAVRDLPVIPAKDEIRAVTCSLRGGREFTRAEPASGRPLLQMVMRDDFDAALLERALAAGAKVRQKTVVRGLSEEDGQVAIRLGDGTTVTAAVVIGADGSAGVTGRHVGVTFAQVDLGLELEIAIPPAEVPRWAGRVILDWGEIPASYGWVFPKGDRLTVGVIAARKTEAGPQADATRAYLREFVARLGLAGHEAVRDSGHLTRCRREDAPLRAGRVIVAGDAAGLLEPWTREGISFALRSGALAGASAAKAAAAGSPAGLASALDEYGVAIDRGLGEEMRASRKLLAVFTRHPGFFHGAMSTRLGWRLFTRFCRSELPYQEFLQYRYARLALSVLNRL